MFRKRHYHPHLRLISIIVISCRCGDHVLLSGGPLVSRTGLCSQYEVTALHTLGRGPWGLGRRAQGLSLPLQLQVGTCAELRYQKPTVRPRQHGQKVKRQKF